MDVQITFDCADPAALAAFWAEALEYRVQEPPKGFDTWEQALEAWGVPPENRNDASAAVDPAGAGPRLFFQRVPEGKQAKNRVHLDVRAAPGLAGDARMAALEAAAERLVDPRRDPAGTARARAAARRRAHRDGRPGRQRVLP
nr:VOC family protein [Actinomadura sp. CNU-125]